MAFYGGFFFVSMAAAEWAFAGGPFYGITATGELFTIDTQTGAGTFVADLSRPCLPFTLGLSVTEIEFSKVTRRAFAQYPDGAFHGFEFNIATGTVITGTLIYNGGSYTGLETVGTTWYGTVIYLGGGASPSELRTIDPFTGVSSLVGATGVGPISGLAHDRRSGTMYGIAGGPGPANLYTINLGTGGATVVGSTGIQAGSLEFGPDDRLFAGGTGANAGSRFVIDPATGASTLVGPTVFLSGITGLALTQCYDPSNPFQNCGFETGDFTSWVTQDLSSPSFFLRVAGGGQTPGFGFFTSDPTEGGFAALHGWDGSGPGHIRVAQDVTMPSGGGARLEFDYRAGWSIASGAADRTFDVMVEPAGGGTPLATTRILTANAGTTNLDTANLLGTVDLSAFDGQAVRITFDWFIPGFFTGPAFFQLDNVRVTLPAGYFTVSPCRVVDTRNPNGAYGGPALAAGFPDRTFAIAGQCNIPSAAKAVSVNLAVTQPTATGNLRLYPPGTFVPLSSSLNYAAGQTRSNNAIVPLNALGELAVHCAQASGTAHFILDVNGYFQ